MKKNILFIILIVLGISFIAYVISQIIEIEILKPSYDRRMESFYGKIDEIKYEIDSLPIIKINNNIFLLLDSRMHDLGLKVGDSIIKRSNSFDYIIYRKDSSDKWVLIFGNP